MPIQTDLSQAPYYDDYNEKDNYHRILFKPSVAVQVRELNQLQTILQKQVERFGDNIYKRGTIIDGCNFTFNNLLPFAKINDVQTDGAPVNVSSFKGLFAKNANNVMAQIIETSSGFEATDPNLNTLHLKYVGSSSLNETVFSPGQVLTIYNPAYIISEADVEVKSSGFSNNDNLVILSAVEISNTTGGDDFVNSTGQACTFSVGETITQSVTGAQAQIYEVNTTANVQTVILKIKPLASNLRLGNTVSWLFAENYEFTTSQSQITGVITSRIGKNAFGSIVTDSTGGIKSVAILNNGTGYYVEPWLTVSYKTPNTSPTANAVIDALRISSKNYLCNVTINDSTTSIGVGSGISVSEGIIYQKGHFVRVSDQFLVVEKYSPYTNNVVGFDTIEEIITFRQDEKLLDNAGGSLNERAPGADRLKLTPKLISVSKQEADGNTLFLPIIEYSLGKPAIQRKTTQFNSIEKELALRTFEQSGNYVLDQFLISTADIDDNNRNCFLYRVNVDPGTAYIDGYRVKTYAPIARDNIKAQKTVFGKTTIPINYGNYIVVKEFSGFFNFVVGDIISLRDAAKTYISSSVSSSGTQQFPTITAAGQEIGTAKMRYIRLNNVKVGVHGNPTTEYRIYLYDLRMNRGKNFKDVKSVFYDGVSHKGVADVSLVNGEAQLNGVRNSSLLFPTGLTALRNINSISYTYRAVNPNLTLNTDGSVTISVAQNLGEYFEYDDTLTAFQRRNLQVIPLATAQAAANASGGVIVQGAGNVNLIGVGTDFRVFRPGDYIRVANSIGDNEIRRITKVTNATHIKVDGGFTNNLGAANVVTVYPKNVTIPLLTKAAIITTNVISNTTLYINIGNTLSTSVPLSVSYDVKRTVTSVPKTITRNALVKINTNTNDGGVVGPWCLGLSDIIRLKTVYQGKTIEFNGNSTIVDSNQDIISFTNTDLVDGDMVIYCSATGNTTIGGLSNNQTYYVKDASSTGIKLSLTPGGAANNITHTATDTTQYLLSVSRKDTKITSNFYIDHNQRKDYYDVGYLYKQPTYNVEPNRLLLVEFDVLSVNEEGAKTVTSYPINDSLPFVRNLNAMHTLEIPELVHDNGQYIDLRDALDFRLYSSNTALIATDVIKASVNPVEPSGNARFDFTVNKKFPIPDTVCEISYEKYLPRIDSVVIHPNTHISIINGVEDEKPKAPKIPKEALLLNHLIVPPYPSLPKVLSRSTIEYLSKNIINVIGINKRVNDSTISTPIDINGISIIQSKPYTMKDIASLERRIADLEYYSSLSFKENSVSNLDIPSSVDATINRFKFGFFVDNFTTSDYAELSDPSYYAQIFGFELTPRKKQLKLEYKFNTNDATTSNCVRGKKILLPARETIIIQQNQATEATTVRVATTETTFTTTGTEIAKSTTNVIEITAEEWELKTQEMQYQILATSNVQSSNTVTKQRQVVKYFPDGDGVVNADYWSMGVGLQVTGSALGGRMMGDGSKERYASYPILQINTGSGWSEVSTPYRTEIGSTWTINYSWPAQQPAPQFRFYHQGGAGGEGYRVRQNLIYTKSRQELVLENYDELVTTSTTDTRYDTALQTIYSVNKNTNVTTKEELIVDTTLEETTTAITRSLFNPKPAGLIQMEELFNLPGQINSPTVDLFSYIQSDINS